MRALLLALVLLAPVAHAAPATARPRQGPPYPIVLVHGFGVAAQVGPLDYWWKLPQVLREHGERVYVADDAPLRAPLDRAHTLAALVDHVLDETHAAKVTLVAHSMGGLDARVLIGDLGYGDRVAALVTIATPHRGTPVADAVLGLVANVPQVQVASLANALAALVADGPHDVMGAARVLSTAGARAFNAAHPDDRRVAYFSVVGRTTRDPLFLSHHVDFVDAPLWPTFAYLESLHEESDGLVPVSSQKWGEVLLDVPADHYNLVNQPLGLVGVAFDPLTAYLGLVHLLHERGY